MSRSPKPMDVPFVQEAARAITPELCRRFRIRLLYLFGSQARGDALPTSDVDFAVDLDPSMPSGERRQSQEQLIADLMIALGRNDVSVVLLEDATALLLHRIVTEGVLLWEGEPGSHAQVVVRALREYDDTRSLREAVRQSLKRL